ncbi:MAG: hypothetical protein HN341_09220 [Verrucomicrobia bacterium]|nr:hypothetical protein [Verrucomicrobiota bacterium]
MELIVIFVAVLVLFGPRRLPEIAKMIGKTLQELRRASEDFKDQVLSIEPVEREDVSGDSTDAGIDEQGMDPDLDLHSGDWDGEGDEAEAVPQDEEDVERGEASDDLAG